MKCSRCEIGEETRRLQTCPICRKPFCYDCAYRVGGKDFCGKGCGMFFFFGEGDEDAMDEED
ncbi:MAG: hypothetical protein ACE5ID_00585 [Acidobacteriota bacterium]